MNHSNTLTALIAAAVLSAAPALAHAVVRTETGAAESMAGASETYRLNVPVEKDMATTEVRLVVPKGVSITRFQVTPGFVRTTKTDDAGLVTEVTWKGKIAPIEYARFFFQARNPAVAGDLSWNIYQKYADGSVVAWDGTDPQLPASKTAVK
ncbi:DUF1775 domain-containing protein [Deinococcus detaillensis]|uniref:DUF1775 domain-containing protein n=1 Tax=Deinococcus detaillensis TaxID=2592048 RepID=A0A553UWV0_9DEIO|nr:DUF1775 domain-containing protein [Deinococcus detaillensis]TSA84682.1 DUF1775 domain-containing protein [Deinococcus detaillensis]